MKKLVLLLALLALVAAEVPSYAEVEFNLIGMLRFRGEYTDNFTDFSSDGRTFEAGDFGGFGDAYAYFPYRAMLGVDADFGDGVHGVIAFQNADVWGGIPVDEDLFGGAVDLGGSGQEQRDTVYSNADNVDLFLAYIDMQGIGGTKNNLKIGRQKVTYGNQMLLGDLDFYNGTSHDAIVYRYGEGDGGLSAFWSQNSETLFVQADTHLFGVDYQWNELLPNAELEAYLLYYRMKVLGDPTGGLIYEPAHDARINQYTLGARIGSTDVEEDGFIWSFEAAYQFGSLGTGWMSPSTPDPTSPDSWSDISIKAWASEGMFGYNFQPNEAAHSFFLKYYAASGDECTPVSDTDPTCASTDAKGFDPLFQNFHDRLGKADAVYGSNVMSISVGYNMTSDKHEFGAEWLMFNLMETTNGDRYLLDPAGVGTSRMPYYTNHTRVGQQVYSFPGSFDGVILTEQPSVFTSDGVKTADEKDIGWELDLWYGYNMNDHLSFEVGLAYFKPGNAVKVAFNPACDQTFEFEGSVFIGGCTDAATRLWGQARIDF